MGQALSRINWQLVGLTFKECAQPIPSAVADSREGFVGGVDFFAKEMIK
jgi:hypothetical protein